MNYFMLLEILQRQNRVILKNDFFSGRSVLSIEEKNTFDERMLFLMFSGFFFSVDLQSKNNNGQGRPNFLAR